MENFPILFSFTSLQETKVMLAQSRLDDIIDGAVRDEISLMSEIVRSIDRQMGVYDSEDGGRRGLKRRGKKIDY